MVGAVKRPLLRHQRTLPRGCASRAFRGRPFISAATKRTWPRLILFRSVPFGKYWRDRPFLCSFEGRCQGEWGSQQETSISASAASSAHSHLPTLVGGEAAAKRVGQVCGELDQALVDSLRVLSVR